MRFAGLLRVEGSPQALARRDDFGAMTAGHLAEAVTEEAVGEERKLSPGSMRVADGGLHAGSARPGDRDIEPVLRGVRIAKQGADLFHYLEEVRVEMAHHRLRHGLVDAGRDHAGSGSEERRGGAWKRRIGLRH